MADGYAITKRKNSGSNLENNATSIGNDDGNSDDNNNSSAMTNCEKKLRKSLSLSFWPVLSDWLLEISDTLQSSWLQPLFTEFYSHRFPVYSYIGLRVSNTCTV